MDQMILYMRRVIALISDARAAIYCLFRGKSLSRLGMYQSQRTINITCRQYLSSR